MNGGRHQREMDHMPRFAANLAYLFTERPLLERFGAAAAAGFKAVELQAPYDHTPAALKAEIDKHGLTQLGINTFVGGRPGDSGLGAVPGRERDWDAVFKQALEYTVAIGGSAIHCMAGAVPTEQRPAAERTFIANLSRAADLAKDKNVTLLIEPINTRDRPNYFLNRDRAGRRHHRQGRQAECARFSSISTMCRSSAATSSPVSRSTCR